MDIGWLPAARKRSRGRASAAPAVGSAVEVEDLDRRDFALGVAIGPESPPVPAYDADTDVYSLAHILVICCAFWLATTPPSSARLAEAASVRSIGHTCTGVRGMGDGAGFVWLFILVSPCCRCTQPIRCDVIRREQPASPESHGTTCNQVLMVMSGVCGARPAKSPPGPRISNGPPGPCAARMPSQFR
jgi:hypothetical protein